MSIRGTGLRHRRATAMTMWITAIWPSRDDFPVGIESISG